MLTEGELEKFDAAARRGARWIVRHQAGDGFLPSRTRVVESCYKGIWALTLLDYAPEAMRLADVVRGWIADDGDIPSPREEPAFFTTHYLYANTYLAIGAQALGRFDVAQRLFRFISDRQDQAWGGFFSQGPRFEGEPLMDTVSTSISGLAALYLGDVERARRAAGFLGRVFERQPEPDQAFFSTMTPDGELNTDCDPEASHQRIDIHDPEQDWYFIGTPTVFLPHLYEATGDGQYLDLARRYLDYLDQRCCAGAFTDFSSGKSGVGAAHLHRLTGEERYREIAMAVGEFILGHQTPFGCWQESPGLDEAPPVDLAWSDMDMTAEYVLWLRQITRHLGR
jgi:hypothetical protein